MKNIYNILYNNRYSTLYLISLSPLIPFIIPTFLTSRVLIVEFVSCFMFFTRCTHSTIGCHSLVIYFDWSLYVIFELRFECVRISVFISHHSISKYIIWSSWITITIIKVIYLFMFYWIDHDVWYVRYKTFLLDYVA